MGGGCGLVRLRLRLARCLQEGLSGLSVKPEMLTPRRTLDECFVEHVAWVRKGHITQAAVDQDRAQLEARWQPGDECWEWIMGKETAQADGRSGAGARRPNRLGAQRLDPLTRQGMAVLGP